ncbi:aspartyl protease family protein At5g10770-like [Miscanthus floridulus]|uniref:aspartyl protease family protein At5g10770-like n=1 Tax=Miscanthus floridulus TaxID=154761 RepID=UPI003457CD71
MFAVSSPQSGRVSVPLAHRYGPCAPLQTKDELSLAQRLHRDRVRTKYITRRMSRSTRPQSSDASTVSVPTRLGSSYDSQQYLVTVGLGTPAVPQTLVLTTESDLSWVQCKPCNSSNCYPQKLPPFDPSRSSTYTTIPCDSQECRDLAAGLGGNGCTSNWECGFYIHYGSGANTTGVYSSDALTLGPGAVVENFHFGCGHDQEGPFGNEGKYDGVLALGRLPESLVGQTSAEHGGAFSLCLPPTGDSTGFLAFGAPENTSDFVFTPLLTMDDQPWFYQLMLTGISVGGQQLDIPAAVFREGMILASSTTITALQDTAYAALRTAFRSAMAEYPLAPPTAQLDTCYNLTGYDNVTVPTVSLTFRGGATVDLDASSGLLLDGCLAFWNTDGDEYTGLIGSLNQRTIEVLYDLPGSRVGFRTGAC